ncbi:MAG TPA: restriction endonuclease subunit S [Fuerstia sp.]|nr:restriction endonuclease subunit S [Fuerstiella sp.]
MTLKGQLTRPGQLTTYLRTMLAEGLVFRNHRSSRPPRPNGSYVGAESVALTGVSVPHISPTQIEDFAIPVPPIEEQNEIVEHVSSEITRMDILIAEAQRAIELLQERRTALISAAVSGKIDVRRLVLQEPV